MYTTRLNLEAPSIIAASCKCGSIVDNEAKYIIDPHPNSCQTPDQT